MAIDRKRPSGLSVLAFLQAVSGLMYLSLGSYFLLTSASALFFLALGGLSLGVAYGLWNGRGWILIVIVVALGLTIALISFSIITVVIDLVVLYYLTRRHVKAFFGRVPTKTLTPSNRETV